MANLRWRRSFRRTDEISDMALASVAAASLGLLINAPVVEVRMVQAPVVAPASRLAIFPSVLTASLIDDEAEAYAKKTAAINAEKAARKAALEAAERKEAEAQAAKEAAIEAKRQKALAAAEERKAQKLAASEAAAKVRSPQPERTVVSPALISPSAACMWQAAAEKAAKQTTVASKGTSSVTKTKAAASDTVVRVDARAERIAARQAAGEDAPSLFGIK